MTIDNILRHAHDKAQHVTQPCLVDLAVLSGDAVVVTALRESVALYSEGGITLQFCVIPEEPEYIWNVDKRIHGLAGTFIRELNGLINATIPSPSQEHSEQYWSCFTSADLLGRCIRLGQDEYQNPTKYYHWAIDRDATGDYVVRDFWDNEINTTASYRRRRKRGTGDETRG